MRTIDYVIRYVADLDRSIRFYRDVVGLRFKLRGVGYAEFETGPVRFGLFERSKVPELVGREAGVPGPDGEVAILVHDVDAEARRLREAGVDILTGPVDRPWGHRTLHLADPDGLIVELAQEIPRADREGPPAR
ncbi:MAG TPA: VOC family protein [Actinomycetota bacterium]|nr:VOC family protein [Actinomycetota bacterium]